jgi:small subunit ribosomal protein S19
MVKKFMFRGLDEEQLKALSLTDFMKLITSRERRALTRGFMAPQKTLLETIKKTAGSGKFIKTHERNMVIIPQMLGAKLGVFNGKEWVQVDITPATLGHRIGEFAMTRRRVKHSAPGIGASKSSKHTAVK